MSAGQLTRAFAVFQALFDYPEGRPLGDLAAELGEPKAAVFRDLKELAAAGLVRQDDAQRYLLTYKILSLSLRHLARTGVHDAAQPVLDRLARATGELVRLAMVDGEQLVYVAWSQGRHTALRYEPVNGDVAPLFCTASGHAFLASLHEDHAARLVANEWAARQPGYGRNAPGSVAQAMTQVRTARARGHGHVVDSYSEGMTAVAAGVQPEGAAAAIAVVSVAVPTALCDQARAADLARHAVAAALEMGEVLALSRHFRRPSASITRPVAPERPMPPAAQDDLPEPPRRRAALKRR